MHSCTRMTMASRSLAMPRDEEGGEGQTHTHGVEVKPGRRLGVEDQRAGESVPR